MRLACCSPWDCRVRHDLVNEQQQQQNRGMSSGYEHRQEGMINFTSFELP